MTSLNAPSAAGSTPNLTSTVEVMLFEGGALMHALGDNVQAQTLANRIEHADKAALAAGQTVFSIDLDPIELGLAYEAVANTQSLLGQTIAQKLKDALSNKLSELSISYGGSDQQDAGSLGGDSSMGDGLGSMGDEESTDAL